VIGVVERARESRGPCIGTADGEGGGRRGGWRRNAERVRPPAPPIEIRCEALVVLRKHKVVVLWTPSSHGRRHAESGLFFTYRCPNTSNTAARSACRRCTVSQNTSSGGAWGRGAMRQNVCGGANLAPDMRVR